MEDAVMVRSLDEDEVVFEKIANQRRPETNHDRFLERFTSERRKMLAVTGS